MWPLTTSTVNTHTQWVPPSSTSSLVDFPQLKTRHCYCWWWWCWGHRLMYFIHNSPDDARILGGQTFSHWTKVDFYFRFTKTAEPLFILIAARKDCQGLHPTNDVVSSRGGSRWSSPPTYPPSDRHDHGEGIGRVWEAKVVDNNRQSIAYI